jgi:hypothetical protein
MHKQNDDPDSYETWEKLVRTVETLEGGINRNSSAQAITALREVFDRFLAKFPLFFGYWKKYADLEFSIAGTEAAEMVKESANHKSHLLKSTDIRARRRQRQQLCRLMDQLLFFQDRN